MKGFQEMKKTLQVATRIKKLGIVDVLETFNSYISDDFQSQISVPYRQNLDYVLIKLQGLSKLLIRLIMSARKSARYIFGLIKAGSFYIKGTIYAASLAKVWDTGREMCKYTVTLFNNLKSFRQELKEHENHNWIANNCYLPGNLNKWLGTEYEEFVESESYDMKMLITKEDLDNFKHSQGKESTLFGLFKEEDATCYESVSSTNVAAMKVESNNDATEIDNFMPIPRNLKKEVDSEYIHSIDEITTKDRIKLFLKFEERYRKVDVEKSLTIKKIKKKAWKELKNDLNNKLKLMQEGAIVEYTQDHLNEYLN